MNLQTHKTTVACILWVVSAGVLRTAIADVEANEAISRRDFEEALNQGKLDAYDEIIAPEAVLHTASGDIIGLDAMTEKFAE